MSEYNPINISKVNHKESQEMEVAMISEEI